MFSTKKLASLLCAFLLIGFCSLEASTSQKVYVPREVLIVSENSIFLIIGDDDYIPLSALYADEKGLYIYEDQIIAKYGYCRKCKDVHAGGECPGGGY